MKRLRRDSPREPSYQLLAKGEPDGGASRRDTRPAGFAGIGRLLRRLSGAPRLVVRAASGSGPQPTATPTLRRPRPESEAPDPNAQATADRRIERLSLAPTPTRPIDATGHVGQGRVGLPRSGGPTGGTTPQLRRAAPDRADRSVWRAPEVMVLARAPHIFEQRPRLAAPPRTEGQAFGVPAFHRASHVPAAGPTPTEDRPAPRLRRPQPTSSRPPSGYTRRSWRQYELSALQLPPEELTGLELERAAAAPVPPVHHAPRVPPAVHAPATTHLVASSTAAAYSFETIDPGSVIIEHRPHGGSHHASGTAALMAPVFVGDPDGEDVATHDPKRQRSRIRTVVRGEVIADAVTRERSRPVAALRQMVTVATATSPIVELSRAHAAPHAATAAAHRRRTDRSIAGGVAMLVLVASFVGIAPLKPVSSATGNTERETTAPRIAIGVFASEPDDFLTATIPTPDEPFAFEVDPPIGTDQLIDVDTPLDQTAISFGSEPAVGAGVGSQVPPGAASSGTPALPLANRYEADETPVFATDDQGPFLSDGTLVKPVVVETTVPDAKDKLRAYKVKKGDTTADIAKKFKVTAATIVWANEMTDVADLDVGQTLVIPPVAGIVHVVQDGETLSGIARRTGIDAKRIVAASGLTETTVFIGQTLIIPGGKGEPIPAPTETTTINAPSGGGSVSIPRRTNIRTPVNYSGGAFAWPQTGGEITQFYHYGHYALDIAADYGVPIRTAASGVVIFAGWKNNGGGWQVWISHGSDLYTTYNHMSSISVGVGQGVDRGQQVGNNGMSGWATGPHVHFEVWIGPVWEGGRRVNPLNYM